MFFGWGRGSGGLKIGFGNGVDFFSGSGRGFGGLKADRKWGGRVFRFRVVDSEGYWDRGRGFGGYSDRAVDSPGYSRICTECGGLQQPDWNWVRRILVGSVYWIRRVMTLGLGQKGMFGLIKTVMDPMDWSDRIGVVGSVVD